MADIPFPRGVRDLLPNEALFRNELLARIESVFQRFGFLSIDTPLMESLDILNAKGAIGEDAKLIFEIKGDKLGMRYDQTVSLARFVAMHQNVPLPFKRYSIGKNWRRDEPQKGRYREFTQADVDIIGGETAQSDAEVLAAIATAFDEIGIDYEIRISNRQLMNSVFEKFGVKKELAVEIMRTVDKLEKLGRDKIIEMLGSLSLERDVVSRIDNLINLEGTNEEKIGFVRNVTNDKSVEELASLVKFVSSYAFKGSVIVDFSVVRGLDYYTGSVFEFVDSEGKMRGSIAGGGRYDNLIGLYTGKSLPAVGIAIGIDPLLDVMEFSNSIKYTYSKVFVVNVNQQNYEYALRVANLFRSNGIKTDINVASRNLSNQLSYANSLKFNYAAIVGDIEQKAESVKIRNLVTGEESTMPLKDAVDMLK